LSKSRRITILLVLLVGLLLIRLVLSFLWQEWPESQEEFPYASAKSAEWFRDAKFGMFIHWGPCSIIGAEIGWSRGGKKPERDGVGHIPVETYDNLYKQFNPTQFDAQQWVDIAQSAGMRYLVFVSKHHDGFSMFDTQLSDYKITRTPFGRDIAGELAKACHEKGLRLGLYYSAPDWYHPDYWTENHHRYLKFMQGQVRELCSNYGQVDILWFDAQADVEPRWDGMRLVKSIRELQPDALINGRLGTGSDFMVCEQSVGLFNYRKAWETCLTLGEHWSFAPDDKLKSADECIRTLVSCAGKGGNLLLNVTPLPTGEIEPRQIAALEQIGDWLKTFGQSIYETRKGPFEPTAWGVCTHKNDTIYIHILDWSQGPVTLPTIRQKIVSHTLLTGGTADIKSTPAGIEINVPEADRRLPDTIVVLKLDGEAKTAINIQEPAP